MQGWVSSTGLGKDPQELAVWGPCQWPCHRAWHLPPLSSPLGGLGARGRVMVPESLSPWPHLTWVVQSTTSLGPENRECRRLVSPVPCGGWRLARGEERDGVQGRQCPDPILPQIGHKKPW